MFMPFYTSAYPGAELDGMEVRVWAVAIVSSWSASTASYDGSHKNDPAMQISFQKETYHILI